MLTDTLPPYSFTSSRMTFEGKEYGIGSSVLSVPGYSVFPVFLSGDAARAFDRRRLPRKVISIGHGSAEPTLFSKA